jgi:hypothetical protein
MRREALAIVVPSALVLLAVVFALLSGQQGSNCDPWLDFNGDGRVDVSDLQALGQTYGGSARKQKHPN